MRPALQELKKKKSSSSGKEIILKATKIRYESINFTVKGKYTHKYTIK